MPRPRLNDEGKMPFTFTTRERDLIRAHTVYDAEFGADAEPVGKGVRLFLAEDELDDLLGYVAAAANHVEDAKLEKELDALFDKLEVLLDRFD